jgi:tetratricopeptide (TPR) repeat protein
MWPYVVVATVLVAAAPVRAEGRYERARSRFAAAMNAFHAHRYEEAAQLFRESYSLAPLPELLVDLARCEEELGQPQAALDDYERYLAAAPEGQTDLQRDVAGRVRTLHKVLASRAPAVTPAAAAPPEPNASPPSPSPAPTSSPPPASTTAPASPNANATLTTAVAPAPVAKRSRARRGLWIGLGAGAGVLVATVVVLGVTLGVAHAPPATSGGNYVPVLH